MRSSMRRSGVMAVVATLAAAHTCLRAQSAELRLKPGTVIERHIEGTASDKMRILLSGNQFLRLDVEQKGSDLAVRLSDPQGTALMDADSGNENYGPETIVAIAGQAGVYALEVKIGGGAPSGDYTLQVRELRPVQANDAALVAAFRDYYEGTALQGDGKWDAAEKELTRTAAFFHEAGESYREGLSLYSLASSETGAGAFRDSVEVYRRAAQVLHDAGASREEALALNNWGGALDVLGDPDQALQKYQEALTLARANADTGKEVLLNNNIGWAETNLSQWQAALEHFNEALKLNASLADPGMDAQILNNMGVVYRQLGEIDHASELFEKALVLWRKAEDASGEATTLESIAQFQLSTDHAKEALENLQAARALWEKIKSRRGLALTLALTGQAYTKLGRFEDARQALEKSLELARAVQDRLAVGRSLISLSRAALASGEGDRAAEWANEALVEYRAGGNRLYTEIALEQIARAEAARGNLDAARTRMEEALRAVEHSRVEANSEGLRASFFATQQDSYGFYINVLMRLREKHPDELLGERALEANERARARTLLEMLADLPANVREGVDPKLTGRERDIANLLNVKGTLLLRLSGTTDARVLVLKQEIRQLEMEYQDVEAAVRKSSPRYAAMTHPEPLTVEQIQKQVLDDDTVLLEYSLGEERSYLWVVGKQGVRSWQLPGRLEIERQAREVRELLAKRTGSDKELETAARRLGEMVIGPAAPAIEGKRLAIVADGELQRVPFAMLAFGTSGPLIVRHEIVMLPSASSLAALRGELAGRKPASKMLAAVADPVFDTSDPRAAGLPAEPAAQQEGTRLLEMENAPIDTGERRLHIPRLPFTTLEVERILQSAPADSFRATGFDASRAMVTSGKLSDYRYIHFATHGYLDTERPALSALVLSQIDSKGQPEDGFLRTNDVYNLRLSADLVVLSACQTGLGREVRGEGLMGLTRAFMYAGAPRVIVSLWSVSDRATADLMANFYNKLLKEGERPSAALREAQLELMGQKQWASPYYWAAFEQQGDWR